MLRGIRGLMVVVLALWAAGASSGPITDTVTVGEKEWAQVDLFINLSWNDIHAVCPAGNCADGGLLNGFEMTAWSWASTDDLNALFNSYIGSDELGPGPEFYVEENSTWLAAFFADGWRDMNRNPYLSMSVIQGVTNACVISATCANSAGLSGDTGGIFLNTHTISTMAHVGVDERSGSPGEGGWFFRSATAAVPAPATFVLVCLGLMALGVNHRKHVSS